mmetsp:Transcript_33302/g.69999  ORF Transcript_33302/g.69999 Transcript_33302/m.69999 type:complete len:559 (+) Transcript_33302:16-1692(+)
MVSTSTSSNMPFREQSDKLKAPSSSPMDENTKPSREDAPAATATAAAAADAIDNPLSYAFLSELFHGLRRGATHAADGAYLFAAGAVVGTRNLMVGIYRTPEAMRASRAGMMYYPQGKKSSSADDRTSQRDNHPHHAQQVKNVAVWDYYSLDYEDADVRLEEDKLRERSSDRSTQPERKRDRVRNIRRRRASVSVKNRKYYDVLGVETDADPKEIRSAYRKEALKHHPDKQNAHSPPSNANGMPEAPHVEGFLDLTEAYRILSDDASRDAYDRHGLCFREETSMPEKEGSHEDYVDLIDELFGANAVRDYVGDVQIAPIVNEMFGFASENRNAGRENAEVRGLQQQRRTVDIAKFLRDRVDPYVRGEMSMEEFVLSCRKEANFILREGGEPTAAFLRVIGRTMMEEADQRIGHVLPFVRKKLSVSSQKFRSSMANIRVYAPIYFRTALERVVSGDYDGRESDDDDDCSGGHNSRNENVDQVAVLDLLWQYVVNDSVATLREACEKVFADQGARDVSLAFVRTPSLMKYHRAKRADAVRILAREMLAASAEVSEKMDER